MTHSMNEDARPFLLKSNAYETYISIQTFRPLNVIFDEQRVTILTKLAELDPIDIKQYVQDIQIIQVQLMRMDTKRELHESRPSAFMTQLVRSRTPVQSHARTKRQNGLANNGGPESKQQMYSASMSQNGSQNILVLRPPSLPMLSTEKQKRAAHQPSATNVAKYTEA